LIGPDSPSPQPIKDKGPTMVLGLCLLLSILGQAIWLPSIKLQHPGHLLLKANYDFPEYFVGLMLWTQTCFSKMN
jgi:hypothetical protein